MKDIDYKWELPYEKKKKQKTKKTLKDNRNIKSKVEKK